MNPLHNNYYQQSLSYLDSIRDKTNSHAHQPILNHNNHTPSYSFLQTNKPNHLNLSLNHISLGQTSPFTTNYSDNYKSYYMESFGQNKSLQKKNIKYDTIQPYQRVSVNELNSNQNNNRYNILPHSPSMPLQKSLQRKRFFTVTSKSPQHSSSSSMINQQHSCSVISQQSSLSQNSSVMIKPQQQKVSKKEGYQFAAHRLSISKTQNNINPQQKSRQKRQFAQANNDYSRISSRNSGQSLVMENKQSKKISLKRDIISPRYEEFQQRKKLSLISNQNPNLHSKQNQRNFSKLPYTNCLAQENDHFGTLKKRNNYIYQSDSQILKIQSEQLFPHKATVKTQDIVGNGCDNTTKNQQKVSNQIPSNNKLLKKQQITQIASIQIVKPSHQTIQTRQQAQVSISTPKSTSPNKTILIDSDIYQDMKISRIEQSTFTLQTKLLQIQKTLQTLLNTHQLQQKTICALLTAHQQQQTTINQLKTKLQSQQLTNTNHTSPNHRQIDPHQDFKKIKKQLKIIKNNFELAFTSMTEQINRKLIKQQLIMKNLSEQIKTIASENIKLSQSIQQKSSKVLQLQKSMTSFMQQNQERIQNIVLLNDSYSSSANKRNRNNHSSFEYGLQLKNVSGEDGGLSGREKEFVEIMRVKLECVEKEIKKMKVFHMQEKEVGLMSMNQLREMIGQFKAELNSLSIRSEEQSATIPQLVSQSIKQQMSLIIKQKMPFIINEVSQSADEKLTQLHERFTLETKSLTESLMEMPKSMNEQLQEFRWGKLLQKSQQIGQVKDSLSLSLPWIKGESSMVQKQILLVKDKLSSLQQKLFSIDRRYMILQQKARQLHKWQQDSKMKELKESGNIRQLYKLFIQLETRLNESIDKSNTLSNIERVTSGLSQSINSMNQSINSLKVTMISISMQVQQMVNASKIQTENIESINNEFQRVINKEIIPKFHQIHIHHLQTQKKLTQLKLSYQQKNQNKNMSSQSRSQTKSSDYGQNFQKGLYIEDLYSSESGLFKKVESFVNDNIKKFINNKVKLFSTKLISTNSPLLKLSLIQTSSTTIIQSDSQVDRQLNKQNCYQNNRQSTQLVERQKAYLVERQNTYLVDEDGCLMDWEGAYLMEMRQDGTRRKIRLTDKEIYFMEVNGINITHAQQYP